MVTSAPAPANGIYFRQHDGAPGRGDVVQLTRDSLIFEMYPPDLPAMQDQSIPELTIYSGGRPIYRGGATIRSVLSTGRVVTISAQPLGEWSVRPGQVSVETAEALLREWDARPELMPALEKSVTRLRAFLQELCRWVATEAQADSEQSSVERAEAWCGVVHPKLARLFADYEEAALQVPRDRWPAHRAFVQRELHPLTLCAPFVHRTFYKPLGYAGDYEMVNMILRNRPEGPNMFAAIVNAYFLRLDVAEGHRNRIARLTDTLEVEARRVAATGRRMRVLNLGCGPAVEVSRFIRTSPLSDHCDLTLLDFNEETIEYATRQLDEAIASSGRGTTVRFVHRSVRDLVADRSSGGESVRGVYDLVYCAGLFDYLSDRVCSKLLQLMYAQAREGGLVLATNVHPSHRSHAALDALGEWELIVRDEAEMCRLVEPIGVPANAFTEAAGTNVFVELRKSAPTDDSGSRSIRRGELG